MGRDTLVSAPPMLSGKTMLTNLANANSGSKPPESRVEARSDRGLARLAPLFDLHAIIRQAHA
jgi:hypothetical protein